MDDFLERDALDQATALATGEISAEALMRLVLARIEAVNGTVNAIVSLRDSDALIAEAQAADAAPRRGWMHGLPLAVKDLANVAGLPTSHGSPVYAGEIAERDDLIVARMRAAGAIIIGKTNTPEFGLGSHTFNPVHGATRNPWDPERSAGGSSGGAGAALACRMLAVADGSDMMGSLRNPGAWNNVYGFRPSWGRVPAEPLGETFLHQLATEGPMGRSPRDVAALLDVLSGPDPRLPHGCAAAPALPEMEVPLARGRIGWLGDWGGALPMEPGLMELHEAALSRLAALGFDVEPVAPPFAAEALWRSWLDLRAWSVAARLDPLYEDPGKRNQLKPEAIWEIERGRALSAMAVHRASEIRSAWFRRAAKLFAHFDALLLPTTQVWPFPVEWRHPDEIAGVAMDSYHRWMEVVVPVSLIGLPCLNIPSGFGATGLPAGLQLFGPRGSDARLLRIGQAWHEATDFAARRPPVLDRLAGET